MKDGDRITSTVALVDSMFSGVRSSFERGATKCWLQDEWARGAWGFVGFREFLAAQSAEGRVHFAGEHLSPFFSWMQGAISSALKAVKEIDEAPDLIKAAA